MTKLLSIIKMTGVMNRKEYIMSMAIIYIILQAYDYIILNKNTPTEWMPVIQLMSIPILFGVLSTLVRRYRDIGVQAWKTFIVLGVIMTISLIFLELGKNDIDLLYAGSAIALLPILAGAVAPGENQ